MRNALKALLLCIVLLCAGCCVFGSMVVHVGDQTSTVIISQPGGGGVRPFGLID